MKWSVSSRLPHLHLLDSKAVWLVSAVVLNSPAALGFQQVLQVAHVAEQLVVLMVVKVVVLDLVLLHHRRKLVSHLFP